MLCKNCGAQISDIAKFCPKCGTPVSQAASVQDKQAGTATTTGPTGYAETSNTQSRPQQEDKKTYQYPYQQTTTTGINGKAVAALILGLIAIPLSFATIVGAIIAFIFSIVGIVLASNSRKTYGVSGVATAGLVFSIIALIISIIRLLALAACGAACGALMCSMY